MRGLLYTQYIFEEAPLKTKVFKSGNSIAVRIPKEIAEITEVGKEVQIEKVGETLVIRSLERQSLANIGKLFAQFGPDFMPHGRDFIEEREVDWDKFLPKTNSEA